VIYCSCFSYDENERSEELESVRSIVSSLLPSAAFQTTTTTLFENVKFFLASKTFEQQQFAKFLHDSSLFFRVVNLLASPHFFCAVLCQIILLISS